MTDAGCAGTDANVAAGAYNTGSARATDIRRLMSRFLGTCSWQAELVGQSWSRRTFRDRSGRGKSWIDACKTRRAVVD